MVRIGDTWKDLEAYIEFRMQHLRLELGKIPYVTPKEQIELAKKKVNGRLSELEHLRTIINHDIKSASKYEYAKVKHIEEVKRNRMIEKRDNGK